MAFTGCIAALTVRPGEWVYKRSGFGFNLQDLVQLSLIEGILALLIHFSFKVCYNTPNMYLSIPTILTTLVLGTTVSALPGSPASDLQERDAKKYTNVRSPTPSPHNFIKVANLNDPVATPSIQRSNPSL